MTADGAGRRNRPTLAASRARSTTSAVAPARSGARRIHLDGTLGNAHVQLWCGQTVFLPADEVPAGEKLCGTCEGCAVGAGHRAIAGEPVSSRPPPPICPAVWRRLVPNRVSGRWPVTAECPACGELAWVRVYGRGYDGGGEVLERHVPGVRAGRAVPVPSKGPAGAPRQLHGVCLSEVADRTLPQPFHVAYDRQHATPDGLSVEATSAAPAALG